MKLLWKYFWIERIPNGTFRACVNISFRKLIRLHMWYESWLFHQRVFLKIDVLFHFCSHHQVKWKSKGLKITHQGGDQFYDATNCLQLSRSTVGASFNFISYLDILRGKLRKGLSLCIIQLKVALLLMIKN